MPAPLSDETIQQIRDELAAGASLTQCAETCGVAVSTVSRIKKMNADTVDDGKRIARAKPQEVEAEAEADVDEGGASAEEVEYLRARVAELTEHACDMSIELVRLQRVLRSQEG